VVTTHWIRALGIVIGLTGLFMLAGGTPSAAADDAALASDSIAYLQTRAADWGIGQADQEFRLRRVVRDALGETHVRLDQVYQGVPVLGQQLIVHFDRSGSPRSATGGYLAGITAATRPVASAQDAVDAARLQFAGSLSTSPQVDLVLYPTNGGARLAYRVVLTDETVPRRVVAFVDAQTGVVFESYNDLRTVAPAPMWPGAESSGSSDGTDVSEPAGPGVTGAGNSLYSGAVNIETTKRFLAYIMLDGLRGGQKTVTMWNTGWLQLNFRDRDNVWGNSATSDPASAGVDAHFGAAQTWDYFLNVHARNGIYNNGVGALSRVHYKNNYNNAFWNDACKCMTYGDGDGVVFSPLTSLDVAGHEMTHGVTSATADLIYANQSGGLNESMSDIFGTMVEFYASVHGATKTPNYLIGEDIYTPATPGDALRYMHNPKLDGSSIDNFPEYTNGMNVHYSSGIANVAFYLLAEGGVHPTTGQRVAGIGRSAAENIFFRALTVYMIPSETFSQARASTIQAATDLFGAGSAQVTSVTQAWNAVLVP